MIADLDLEGSPLNIDADQLAAILGTDSQPPLIDVREPEEFADWAIGGAVNIPLGSLPERMSEIASILSTRSDNPSAIVLCARGNRSAKAVAFLRSAGIDAINLIGGMAAWGNVYDHVSTTFGSVEVIQVRRRGKGCLSYIVSSGHEAFVIDPSLDTSRYVELAATLGSEVTRVFDTHLHADHVSGARLLAEATGASLHLNSADTFRFAYTPLVDGEAIPIGGSSLFSVTAFTTPGHTRGSSVFSVGEDVLFTGDTLFTDGVGRPDLADHAEEFSRNLFASLSGKIGTLPKNALVMPAHYGDTEKVKPGEPVAATLGELVERLPQLAWDEESFVDWAKGRATPRPPRYGDILKINMGLEFLGVAECKLLESGPNRCAA